MLRRDFLKSAAVGSLGLFLNGCLPESSKSTRAPNIIFLLTDDQRARTLGCSGHSVIKTPNLDKLAKQGIRFTNAFIAEPTCAPSRVTYFTGQYERVHGVGFSSEHKLTETQWEQTYPAQLRQAGYYTGFIGKFGVENYVFKGNASQKFDFWRAHDGWARFFPKKNKNCKIYQDSKEDIITPIMSDSIERFLNTAPEDKPFCLSVSFSAPHGSISGSMVPGESGDTRMTKPANSNPLIKDHPIYGKLYRDKQINIPKDTATDPGKYIPAEVLDQSLRKKSYPYSYTKPTCLEHHYRYYQLITGIDKTVGNLLKCLKQKKLWDNTVIIFTSDHGLLMGEYGMGGKALLYDLATRIPLIIYDPRLETQKRGKETDQLVISTDIAPTILSLAGLKARQAIQGRSLLPLINNPTMKWRDYIFLENLYVGRHNPFIEAVRTKTHKYIRYFETPFSRYSQEEGFYHNYGKYSPSDINFSGKKPVLEQLFDLQKDPDEKNNLVKNSKYADVLNEFRQRCQRCSEQMIKKREKFGSV
ncbi:MAG: sulfatase-like hydrolase/transferase [Planctomycetota bacterium]|jgi:arylsulfatase A-like enzyme